MNLQSGRRDVRHDELTESDDNRCCNYKIHNIHIFFYLTKNFYHTGLLTKLIKSINKFISRTISSRKFFSKSFCKV